MLDQGLAERRHRKQRKKGRNANQFVMWIHANYSRQSCWIKVRQKGDTGEKGVMQAKLWWGFTQTIPGSHVESRFDRKETWEKKGVMQTGQIYTETELWACKETAWRRRKENGSSKKKTDQELEQGRNRKSAVEELIPETGRTHPHPSPTPTTEESQLPGACGMGESAYMTITLYKIHIRYR